jgi:hypothetical protein
VVIGGTGKGKTSLIHRIVNSAEGAVIILSPDGDLAERVGMERQVTKSSPVSINPLTADYLELTDKVSIFTEALNTAVKLHTDDKQMPVTSLMEKLIFNAIRVGVKDFKKLADFLYDENIRKSYDDHFWHNFDRRDAKGWLVDKEQVESAKRVSARLDLMANNQNVYGFLKGNNAFHVKDIVEQGKKYIFDFSRFDWFSKGFLGGLILLYIKVYYNYDATQKSPPLYVFVDECHRFVQDTYFNSFVEARKYNVSYNITFHHESQLNDRSAKIIMDSADTVVKLGHKFEAEAVIGGKIHHIRLFPPEKYTPQEPVNFLRSDWIVV